MKTLKGPAHQLITILDKLARCVYLIKPCASETTLCAANAGEIIIDSITASDVDGRFHYIVRRILF